MPVRQRFDDAPLSMCLCLPVFWILFYSESLIFPCIIATFTSSLCFSLSLVAKRKERGSVPAALPVSLFSGAVFLFPIPLPFFDCLIVYQPFAINYQNFLPG